VSVASILPEALRNIRIQLRPKRMLAAALICAAVSFTAYVYYMHPYTSGDAGDLFSFLLILGVTVITIGGGIYCLQSVHREKELNTFDYQRITRLTPFELTLGKLFGAPSLAYFILVCLVPITLVAAFLSHMTMVKILWIYAILLLGSITWHAFALLVSLLVGRGTSAGAIILFLLLVLLSSSFEGDRTHMLGLRRIGPYALVELSGATEPSTSFFKEGQLPDGQDLLFGAAVPHVLVLVVLYMSLTGWFLLGLVRNMKRDPSVYEIFSPVEAFCLVLYLNLIVLVFFQWTRVYLHANGPGSTRFTFEEYSIAPSQAENELLSVSLWLFAVFGLTLLRNRERVRHRILELGPGATNWWAALWPGPYLLAGVVAVGFAMIAMIEYKLHPRVEWSLGMAVFEVCFVAVWMIRDALYLQWMNLRRSRRSFIAGLIYLIVFYSCSSALFTGLGFYRLHAGASGIYLRPWAIFEMNFTRWTGAVGAWIGALVFLACEALVFAALQRWQLTKLRESAAV
jgi:hypothetical protein